MNAKTLLNSKETKNAFWIIFGKVSQMMISFFISIWTTRYLGPSNYGLISYVSAYVAFFSSLCTLGITAVIMINELTRCPEEEGTTIGTTIVLRIISSILSVIMIVSIVSITDCNEPATIIIAFISSLSLVFQAFDVIEYWFQKQYLSKITSIASFIAYLITSLYKLYLLSTGKSVYYFAAAISIDYIVIAICLFCVYKKRKGPRLKFSWYRGKEILSKSYHFILSGLMVAIYGQTDKIMLKHMVSETEVGYYTLAYSLTTMWVFILGAIITSLSPTIIALKNNKREKEYQEKNVQLYALIIYISLFVSVCYTLFSEPLINILYGKSYSGSVVPLRIINWYVAFSYLGVARDTWMVCENKQKYSKYMYLFATILNIAINSLLIPSLGASGAALASLITQISTSLLLPMLWKDMRPNVKLMLKAMNPKNLYYMIKKN